MDPGRAYLVLGLSHGATKGAVRAAYRRLAKETHPNGGNPGAKASRFAEIAAAHDLLMACPEPAASQPPSRGDDREIEVTLPLESFLPGGRGVLPDRRRCGGCGGDGRIALDLPLDCPACGGTGFGRLVQGFIRVRVPCEPCGSGGRIWFAACGDCRGTGEGTDKGPEGFDVPPGLGEGEAVRVPGLGGPGRAGGPRGDLVVRVRSAPHPLFRRSGADLAVTVRVSFADLCLGGEVAVAQLGAADAVRVHVPRGTAAASVLQLPGRGLASKDGKRGRLLVRLVPDVPTVPTAEQEALMERWRETERG
jgi:molecular chaperone DnaJ